MKLSAITILILISFVVRSQEFDGHKWIAPYSLNVPDQWTVERFPIPIGFAPEINYKGVEDIRFSPGWAISTGENYWSYAFLWFLDGEVKMDGRIIEKNLKDYYTGLVKINGQKIPAEKVIPVSTTFREVKRVTDDVGTWEGTVKMTDYMSGKVIELNCRAHKRSCRSTTSSYLFFELSPQPFGHAIWSSLDKLWSDFKCLK